MENNEKIEVVNGVMENKKGILPIVLSAAGVIGIGVLSAIGVKKFKNKSKKNTEQNNENEEVVISEDSNKKESK